MVSGNATWRAVVLGIGVAACAASPRVFVAPVTPIPDELAVLGKPCTATVHAHPVSAFCARERVSMVLFSSHERVTGQRPGSGSLDYDPSDDPLALAKAVPAIGCPSHVLATVTWARSRGGLSRNEHVIYADGPMLWVKTIVEVPLQFPEATLLVADRRLLSAENERFLRSALMLGADVDLGDDAAIARAMQAQPSLRAGQLGVLTR
jgi:hypothetical protein